MFEKYAICKIILNIRTKKFLEKIILNNVQKIKLMLN